MRPYFSEKVEGIQMLMMTHSQPVGIYYFEPRHCLSMLYLDAINGPPPGASLYGIHHCPRQQLFVLIPQL